MGVKVSGCLTFVTYVQYMRSLFVVFVFWDPERTVTLIYIYIIQQTNACIKSLGVVQFNVRVTGNNTSSSHPCHQTQLTSVEAACAIMSGCGQLRTFHRERNHEEKRIAAPPSQRIGALFGVRRRGLRRGRPHRTWAPPARPGGDPTH